MTLKATQRKSAMTGGASACWHRILSTKTWRKLREHVSIYVHATSVRADLATQQTKALRSLDTPQQLSSLTANTPFGSATLQDAVTAERTHLPGPQRLSETASTIRQHYNGAARAEQHYTFHLSSTNNALRVEALSNHNPKRRLQQQEQQHERRTSIARDSTRDRLRG
ncbi:hypothetical protein BDV96DRAFT_666703 [Lophiotrema nucula]|uniref:Uncharacterized protein n=1 Tax=Lophiotrema nucula TaxID=690887 RepID=A0A6A5YUL8_9PLEO|nr:hypothetical protein BDV96DRAFT_666703 [Lophiotrema nucula]